MAGIERWEYRAACAFYEFAKRLGVGKGEQQQVACENLEAQGRRIRVTDAATGRLWVEAAGPTWRAALADMREKLAAAARAAERGAA